MRRTEIAIVMALAVWLASGFVSAMGAAGAQLHLTPEEQKWLDEHPVIRLAPDPDAPPIEFFDDQGTYRGIAADYVRLVEQRLGIKFQIVHLANWSEVEKQATRRDVDVLAAATPSPLRSRYMLFTRPYLDLPGVIIVNRKTTSEATLKDLREKRVALASGYIWEELIKRDYPDIDIERVSTVETALKMVSFGLADAMVDNLATVTYLIDKEGITNLRMAGETGYFCHLAFASRRDWPPLNAILEKVFQSLTPEEHRALYHKWIQVESRTWVPGRLFMILLAASLTALLVASILIWKYLLKRRVMARTAELQDARDQLAVLVDEKTDELTETGVQLEGEHARRKQVEDALRASEYRYRITSEIISDYCYSLKLHADGSYEREWLTESFSRMTGYTSDEITERGGWRTIVHPDDVHVITKKMDAIHKGQSMESEYRIFKKNGEVCWLRDYAQPEWSDREQRVVRIYGAAQDITERKNAEEERRKFDLQLQQTQKLESLGVLAGGIAHDFNNLLMGIMGNAELALQELPASSPIRAGLDQVLAAATRAAELARQMLAYSGKAQLVVEPIDLNSLVKEIANLLEASISSHVLLKFDFSPNLPGINADATQIRQVVMNLITNAADAIGQSTGVIQLATGLRECDQADLQGNVIQEELPAGEYVYLMVKDTGEGMDAQTLKKIFDPFFTTKFIGRGLGLASVLGIVRGHKGCILTTSKPGRGSTFTVLFPALDEAVVEKKQDFSSRREWFVEGAILLVDDDDTIRTVTKRMLKRLGFKVMTAANGREAIEIFQAHPDEICCVLLDLTMPYMDGEEACRRMLAIKADIPIIIASGYAENDILERFSDQNIAGSIHKPYTMETLTTKLREAFL